MTDVHVVPEADFADLATGRGNRSVVERLRAGQLSKNILVLHRLLDLEAIDQQSLDLLGEAQRAAPEATMRVLTYPLVGAWAADTLRVVTGCSTSPLPVEVMTGHLAGIAAAAAAAAGLDFAILVPTRANTVSLPGLGRASVPAPTARVSATGGGLAIDDVPVDKLAAVGDWLPVHRLTVRSGDLTLDVALDDVDYYRDCGDIGAAARLDADQVARWRQTLQTAWTMLVADHRDYAVPIATGLTVLIPIRGDLMNRGVTATSMDAFGAMSSSTPTDPVALAVGLVHEFQHAKLGALMDLLPLHTGSDEERFYAPWRDDPRPLGGLLHGAYAFLGVADFWRLRRRHEESLTGYAQFEFARWRERVSRVIEVLTASGRLTEAGEALVRGMRDTVRSWWVEPVPDEITALARQAADDHRVAWRIRNLECDPAAVTRLARAWSAGEPPPAVTTTRTLAGERVFRRPARLHLTALRLTEPEALATLELGSPELVKAAPDATAADLAYARGELAAARTGYLDLIAADPGDDGAWAGLALCLQPGADDRPSAAESLMQRPEWVVAVHRAAGDPPDECGPPDPVAVAAWLSPAITG
jgi:HEXXH motif-containing protein